MDFLSSAQPKKSSLKQQRQLDKRPWHGDESVEPDNPVADLFEQVISITFNIALMQFCVRWAIIGNNDLACFVIVAKSNQHFKSPSFLFLADT